jgi:hypothetical protein
VTPEEAIETGIYNRLTDGTHGITVAAGKYCADEGGIQLFHGQIDLRDPEQIIQWATVDLNAGPKVLIVAGDSVSYETDHRRVAIGTFTVRLYLAAAHARDPHEALTGDEGGDARQVGLWQVKSDILDRLCNYGVVTDEDPPWPKSGRVMALQQDLVLYEMTMEITVSRKHELVAWSDLDTLTGIDTTLQKKPDAGTGEEIETEFEVDLP